MGAPYAEVIGDPIAHSKSPLIHRFWIDALGLDADYRATHVPPEELDRHLATRFGDPDWRGCNVTMPHKQAAAVLMGSAAVDAGRPTAINCIYRGSGSLIGCNFDVDALAGTVPLHDGQAPVVVLGSGGAALAACEAIGRSRRQVTLIGRNRAQLEALQAFLPQILHIGDSADAVRALTGAAGLINATPQGMRGFAEVDPALLAGLDRLGSSAFVYDMVYDPVETQLVRRARALGLHAIGGLAMLLEQAALSFERFFGVHAPRERDTELYARLTS